MASRGQQENNTFHKRIPNVCSYRQVCYRPQQVLNVCIRIYFTTTLFPVGNSKVRLLICGNNCGYKLNCVFIRLALSYTTNVRAQQYMLTQSGSDTSTFQQTSLLGKMKQNDFYEHGIFFKQPALPHIIWTEQVSNVDSIRKEYCTYNTRKEG